MAFKTAYMCADIMPKKSSYSWAALIRVEKLSTLKQYLILNDSWMGLAVQASCCGGQMTDWPTTIIFTALVWVQRKGWLSLGSNWTSSSGLLLQETWVILLLYSCQGHKKTFRTNPRDCRQLQDKSMAALVPLGNWSCSWGKCARGIQANNNL